MGVVFWASVVCASLMAVAGVVVVCLLLSRKGHDAPPKHERPGQGPRSGAQEEEPEELSPPEVIQALPESPTAGGELRVALGKRAERDEVVYQYRATANGAWQDAPDGQVVLKNLREGELRLEFRAFGSKGRVSPVSTRAWSVRPAEGTGLAVIEEGVVKLRAVPPVVTNNQNALVKKYRARLRLTASSVWAGWPVENALDGNLETSWFSEFGDAAAQGRSPWLQANFPEDVTVTRVTVLGNRDPAWLIGYTILKGRLTVYDADGKELRTLTNNGVGNYRDFDYKFDPPLKGVRSIRFTSLSDQGNHTVHKDIGLAEFQVDGVVK
jgi:hypothetical protein